MTALATRTKLLLNKAGGVLAKYKLGDLIEDALATETTDIADEAVTEAKIEAEGSNGLVVPRRVRAEFDYTDQPLDGAATLLPSALIPDNAIIVNAFLDVTETFTSDDTTPDTTTIGIGVETVTADSEDLINAVSIADATDWDAGIKQLTPTVATVSEYIKTTAARNITVNVVNAAGATEGLTAGHFVLFLDYVVSE